MEHSARTWWTNLRVLPPLIICVAAHAVPGGTAWGTSAGAEFGFDRHEIILGPEARQTVLTGFLLGGEVAELAAVHLDGNGDRRLRLYSFDDGSWKPSLEATLRPGVSFVDVASIGGRDRLVSYEPGRLNWFDPETASERMLVAVTSDYSPPPEGAFRHVDISRDVNDDGRDDLVVPDASAIRVFVQMKDGSFADPVRVGPSTSRGQTHGIAGYRQDPWVDSGVHRMDHNRDGRADLVFWSGGHFKVHLQDERGLFDPEVELFSADVPLDWGQNPCCRHPEFGFDPVEACYNADHGSLTYGDKKEKVVHSVSDLNGDGVADLLVYSLEGTSVFSVHSTYEVYFGSSSPDGDTVFASVVGTSIPSDDLQVVMKNHDYDGDGQTDMMITSIHIGFFKVLGGLLTRSMSLDVEFYRMEDGRYPDEPNTTRKIRIDLSRKEAGRKAVAYPPVLVGDVNGDGRSDLLVGKGRKALDLFLGVGGPELFEPRPRKVAVAIPRGSEYTWLTDLNGDGRQDILIHDTSADEPDRVTMLVARRTESQR